MPKTDLNAVVTARTEVAPGLVILQVAPVGWELYPFTPGQFVALGLPADAPRVVGGDPAPPKPGLIRRSYSIASSSRQREFLELYVVLVSEGLLSPRLLALTPGDPVWLGPKPAGAFTLQEVPRDANLVLVATGTGLAPYMSMLRTHLSENGRRVAVVHGVRQAADLAYREELEAMARAHRGLAYLPVVSRPGGEPWNGAVGRVQDLWRAGAVTAAWGCQPTPRDTHVFLCGNPDMVEAMEDVLGTAGFREHRRSDPGQLHTEKYW